MSITADYSKDYSRCWYVALAVPPVGPRRPSRGASSSTKPLLFFIFNITSGVLYGLDAPHRRPGENPQARDLSPNGSPWFADEVAILLNVSNEWKEVKKARGNGQSCWQMVCNLTKSLMRGWGSL